MCVAQASAGEEDVLGSDAWGTLHAGLRTAFIWQVQQLPDDAAEV